MKRLCVIFLWVGMFACNTKKPSPGSEADNPIVNGSNAPKDSTAEGKALIAKYDCSGCHTPTGKLTGPAFTDIAKRYPASKGVAENLAQSIISGSKGIWGNAVEMPPHNNLPFNDAVKMAEYILSLKGPAIQDSLNKAN